MSLSQGDHMSMERRRAQEPVREVRENTCRSHKAITCPWREGGLRSPFGRYYVRENTCRSLGRYRGWWGGVRWGGVGVETRLIVIVLVCCE